MWPLLKIVAWFILNLVPWTQRKKALKRRNTWREVKKHQWAVVAHTVLVFVAFLILSKIPLLNFLTYKAFLGELAGLLFNIWFFRRLGRTERQVTPEALESVELDEASEERLAAESELEDWLKENA
jgi:protein-S-isoprenylcysteine O-methyltransferase Ste14